MGTKILIVDDSKAIQQSMTFMLNQNGYEVVAADDGVDALEKSSSDQFKLIITDINMPRMNGLDFIKNLRQKTEYKFTPILVLTTESEKGMIEKGKEAGATGWVVKPFSAEKLITTIKKVCR